MVINQETAVYLYLEIWRQIWEEKIKSSKTLLLERERMAVKQRTAKYFLGKSLSTAWLFKIMGMYFFNKNKNTLL